MWGRKYSGKVGDCKEGRRERGMQIKMIKEIQLFIHKRFY